MQQGFLVKPSLETVEETTNNELKGRCFNEKDDVRGDQTQEIARNVHFPASVSSSSVEESVTDTNNSRRGSFDEPSFDVEATGLIPTNTENSKSTVSDPCSARYKPSSPHAVSARSPGIHGSSTSGEECEPDEIYPHHKKFRMHRKRAAALKESTTHQNKNSELNNNNEISAVDMKKCKISESNDGDQRLEDVANNSFPSAGNNTNSGNGESTIDQTGHASVSRGPSPDHKMKSDCYDVYGLDEISYSYGVQSSSRGAFHGRDQNKKNPEQVIPVATNELHECRWLQCTRKFLQLEDLVNHVNDAHIRAERDIDYKCYWENCPRRGKGFNARYKMLIHVRTHTNERPYKCNLCSKSFSRLENLKIHNRSHTGERPYICPFEGCNKAYSNSSDRFKHVRTHQEQKPYCCRMPGCDKRYTDPSSLRKHIKTHGHYFRPASDEKDGPSQREKSVEENEVPSVHSRIENMDSSLRSKEYVLANKSALPLPSTYLSSYPQAHGPALLPHNGSFPLSLKNEELRQLRASEDFQHKTLLEGNFLSTLPLPRPPLLSLCVPFSVSEDLRYSVSPDSPHSVAAGLPLSGPAGSQSPGSYATSVADSEGSNSPLLYKTRRLLESVAMDVTSSLHADSPQHASASPSQVFCSAFSPVSVTHHPVDKYSFLSPRSAFVSRPSRNSPTHHPYARPLSRDGGGSPNSYHSYESHSPRDCASLSPSHSPKLSPLPHFFSRPGLERPLDLSNPSSPETLSDREGSPRMSPPSPYHGLRMYCHQPPRCDLGPAFPALHLLNHA